MSDAIGIICEQDRHHDPVDTGTEWRDRNSGGGNTLTALQVERYFLPRPGSVYHHPRHKWGLDGSIICRMFVASAVALSHDPVRLLGLNAFFGFCSKWIGQDVLLTNYCVLISDLASIL